MKKLFFILYFAFGCFLCLSAQLNNAATIADNVIKKSATAQADSLQGWHFNGAASINFSQVSLTNWTAGGENSLAGTFSAKAALSYRKNIWQWNNDLLLEYGTTYTDSNDWRKNL
ncbi:MAG: DUF3078 domain-containing protein, partial [Prevotellaceae bacterium]|nr:DUF3078 domain-containing protein [Prevotellaceae bacterium]